MNLGDYVIKDSGDYTFEGWIVAVFHKRSGMVRYVVENPAGILHIYSEKNLKRYEAKTKAIQPEA